MTAWQWGLVGLGAALALYAGLVGALLAAGRREDARAIGGFVPDCVVLFRRLAADGRIPRRRRAVLLALIAYLALPVDLVPDFIPVAGQLDDAIVAALALRFLLRGAGPDLVREHWPGPETSLKVLLALASRG